MSKAKKLKSLPKIHDDGFAAYASRENDNRGRLYPELPSKTRGDFERDRDRVIHSTAFRRLKFKTQVFVYHEGDQFRTRLSHSIEVAQVARSLARHLRANEDLAETCALAHDLGHTPFAHVGEDALKECMKPYGGFDHNDQTLRVVTKLEKKYPNFDGLNLTWESLEGLVKHNGPMKKKLEITLKELSGEMDLMLNTYASLEAQIAGIADDIAYNSHDIDDGIGGGIFTLADLKAVEWVDKIIHQKRRDYPGIDDRRLVQETIRDVMGTYVVDVLAETKARLARIAPECPDDVRHADRQIVTMSPTMQKRDSELRGFLWNNFYLSDHVSRSRLTTFKVVQDLFAAFLENPRCLPPEWKAQAEGVSKTARARIVADYIAGLTDRSALLEHKELFDPYRR